MNEAYFSRSVQLLEEWLPGNASEMMQYLETHEEQTEAEEDGNSLVYCLFSFPVLDQSGNRYENPASFDRWILERCILLVYDRDQIIADCSAFHGSMHDILHHDAVIRFLREESEWMDLEHYTLCGSFFSDQELSDDGEALLYANAYVTVSDRRQGIFTRMLQMMRDHALRNENGRTALYSVLSLDPDIACYGPDSSDKPYVYSMAQDEPKRMVNAEIMKKLGYMPVRLEETDPVPDDDGTKLCFAIRKEEDRIIETNAVQA